MKKKLSILLIALLSIGQLFADETATIYIRRAASTFGLFCDHMLIINDMQIGDLAQNDCISIDVPCGILVLKDSITIRGGQFNIIKAPFLTLTTEPNGKYYIKISDGNLGQVNISTEHGKEKKYKVSRELNYAMLQSNQPSSSIIASSKSQPSKSSKTQSQNSTSARILSDVDQNIPNSKKISDDTYVLIIANEEYQFLDNVNFASNDGETFKEYCIKTLGVPERQIRYCPNATYGVMSGGVDWLSYALNNFEGSRAIVYYCGHGIPDEKTNEAYIIPVDGKGTNTTTCYSLNRLYKTLAETKAANITYFMDACFTGANKEGSMLVAARGVAREAKKETISGKSVVFSASSGDETAMTYEEKQHGLFTYYLLKKLQETEGNVTYEDLASYISKNVKKDAFLLNEKPQTPVVATSPAATNTWKSMKLK